jgi:hypothetical protein
MPWIVYLIAGGGTFLPGAGLLVLAIAARAVCRRRWVGILSIATAVIGIASITVSAEAIAWWVYCVWIVTAFAWLLRGRVKVKQFGRDLEQLAGRVCGPGREVVMLELPLFPFDNGYGLQQRRVASRHGIHLIPRKYFVKVIGARGATSDGIHLTAEGQRRMAEMVWGFVGASLRASNSNSAESDVKR